MIKKRIALLREVMKQNNVDIYIVPTSDFHNSEYVGDYFKAREYMSGFTGSAGTLVVTKDKAGLWTDGRYFLQAADQLEGSDIELMKIGEEGVPEINTFIADELCDNQVVGFDGRLFSVLGGIKLYEAVNQKGGKINPGLDLVNNIWNDRPSLSAKPVIYLSEEYSGKASSVKFEEIRDCMAKKDCDYHIVTSLDDIAWILNLRGSDVDCNPVFLSYLLIGKENAVLFANETVFAEHKDYLSSLNIMLKPYNDIYEYVKTINRGSSFMIDENKLNYSLYAILNELHTVKPLPNPSTALKAEKNETEMNNLREANIVDGVAMVKFLYWLDTRIGKEKITEISAANKLEEFRKLGKNYVGLSFDTISGYNAHGAIIHYEPTPETDIEVEPNGLLLVDSGAQYLNGTTDITRTIAVGPLTEEMKHHYTMVLRGHLDLEKAKFKEGCNGANLDILARAPFWDEAEDYNHGTGHGVGFFLNVHEGPQNFHWNTARRPSLTPLKEGMVITDEPGIYIEGKYGVRIENDLLCVKDTKNEYGQFMKFEALTLCPIDLRPVNFGEMTKAEIKCLDDYHDMVVKKLTPFLTADEAAWLKQSVSH